MSPTPTSEAKERSTRRPGLASPHPGERVGSGAPPPGPDLSPAGQGAADSPVPAGGGVPTRPPAGGSPGERGLGLDDPIQYLRGVGPRRAELLARLGVRSPRDLLLTLPRTYSDRTRVRPIAELRPGAAALIIGRVLRAQARRRPRRRPDTVAVVQDESGALEVVWWGQPYMLRLLRPGLVVALFGEVATYRRGFTMNSPEIEVVEPGAGKPAGIVPVYGLTEGVSQRMVRDLVQRALPLASGFEETLPEPVRHEHELPAITSAVTAVHAPESLAQAAAARRRLAFDELLELLVALGVRRRRRRRELMGFAHHPGSRFAQARALLPFSLTAAQERVLGEILADMAATSPMHRLLEGEVGSGKTVVALLAALAAIDSGRQAAIMAPTEILATQHMRTALKLLPGVRPLLLTGAAGSRERRELLASLARGDGDLAIGTHALFSADVRFRRLGLVVVDEQHRFGVTERAAMTEKGTYPDLLVMTATPIPRSLALTVFGDLDLSLIEERPPGRRPARTHVVEATKREKVYEFIAGKLARGEQAFVITPRVEADSMSELAAATERAEELRRHPLLGRYRVGLVHGRLDSRDKEAAMNDFRRGVTQLLVATTVVEVGVDVATVTVILIEHPERFGLSQLHQLRGRVGRGDHKAHAILLVDPDLDDQVRSRLEAFASTDDGFAVAELDLAQRGPGALLGDAQHGFGSFRIAHPLRDRELIALAARVADHLVESDPALARHPALARAIERRVSLAAIDPSEVRLTG